MPLSEPEENKAETKVKEKPAKGYKHLGKRVPAAGIFRWSAFDVRSRNIFDEYITSKDFRTAINTGHYVLADNHLVLKPIGNYLLQQNLGIDDFLSLNTDKLGEYSLSDITLHIQYIRKSVGGFRPRKGVCYRRVSCASKSIIREAKLAEASAVKSISDLTKNEFMAIIGGVGGQEPPNNFQQLLDKHLEDKKVTIEGLSELTGIPDRTIRRIKNEAHRRPALEHIIAICIALHLRPSESDDLIAAAGYTLKNTKKEKAFQFLIDCAYNETGEKCNAFLNRMGLHQLTKL